MDSNILDRYRQAEQIMHGWYTNKLVMNDAVFSHWITPIEGMESTSFWYLRETDAGTEYRLVDVKKGTNTPAFDHQELANLLAEKVGVFIKPENLPISDIDITLSPLRIQFSCLGKFWLYESLAADCQQIEQNTYNNDVQSPDGNKTAFTREHNLWVRNELTKGEYAVTSDGKEGYSYASTFMRKDPKIQAMWSSDSRYIFTVQLDERKVASRSLINFVPYDGSLRPKIVEYKAGYPGDKYVESYKLVVIDTVTGRSRSPNYDLLPYVTHGPETFDGFFTANLGWWANDNRHVFFIDVQRGAKKVHIVKWDTHSDDTKVIIEENSDTYIRICEDTVSPSMFLPLPGSGELIWTSERSGWAHLYLYDLNTGKLKRQITGSENSVDSGRWLVRNILHYDADKRELLIQTAARNTNISPYYRDISKVNIDSGELTQIKAGDFDHAIYSPKQWFNVINRDFFKIDSATTVNGVSPDGRYIVTTFSRVDTPPVSIVVDRNGDNILTVETADTSKLPANWCWPQPAKFKAADGETDIYGVVFRPPGFSSVKQYPVIDFLGAKRQVSIVPQGSFVNSIFCNYYEMAALSSLGFIVVGINGRGTPYRSKRFQDHNFGIPGYDDDLNDHIAAIKQLATRCPSLDVNRVGITAMEAADNVVYGALNHSDFYNVTVSHCLGDPRFFLFETEKYGSALDKKNAPEALFPEDCAASFRGKMLLVCGLMFAEPSMRLAEALQRENKDFDMLCLPNMGAHLSSYSRRRGWDYFVNHLLHIDPPLEYKLTTSEDSLMENIGGEEAVLKDTEEKLGALEFNS